MDKTGPVVYQYGYVRGKTLYLPMPKPQRCGRLFCTRFACESPCLSSRDSPFEPSTPKLPPDHLRAAWWPAP